MSELDDPRVLLAAERTLLAWSRTSLALIGFGFLVERSSLFALGVQQASSAPRGEAITTIVGIGFIGLGAITALLSCLQHVRIVKTLKPTEIPFGYWVRFGMIVNAVVGILGVVLCLALQLDTA
jgi:putative membrane protein